MDFLLYNEKEYYFFTVYNIKKFLFLIEIIVNKWIAYDTIRPYEIFR